MKIYCLYNNKAKAYLMPFFEIPDYNDAVNDVSVEAMNRVKEYVNKISPYDNINPSEFDLFCIGEYDTTNANISMYEVKEHLCNCLELVQEDVYEETKRKAEEKQKELDAIVKEMEEYANTN